MAAPPPQRNFRARDTPIALSATLQSSLTILGKLRYIGRLRPFLSLHNLKFHLISLLQALVALGGDRAVVDEYVRSIVSPQETVSLRVVEPLDGAFQTFHVRPPLFLADWPE